MISGLLGRLRGRGGALEEPSERDEPGASANRRDRAPTPAERQLAEAVAQKLLHGWLQNRHQTLMPLSVNLALLSGEDRGRLARFAALAAGAGTDAGTAARLAAWLAGAGADREMLAAYEAGLGAGPGLGRTLAEVATPETAGLAYVLALVAAREGGSAGQAFADYVAERLMLPSAARRSAQRRHGR